ncbi:Polyphenol oxidase, chloroplastic [Glycine soja]|uniref:Polyphenol oxidase, chloroplastic n=1 Tax=Glycine soja TaxID=3848 RepID=A0A0B2PD92_GLYSO|nr:Polyphenol oxidase, chloroplastic [Glycine soja]
MTQPLLLGFGTGTTLMWHVFLGKPFHPGEEPNNSAGSVESVPHTPVHIWTGDRNQPNGEDMGRFYSAGRDPIFYSHHANVDRMLNISKTIKGGKRRDVTDPDWLETAFYFYDENKNLVRVTIKDSLDTKKLGMLTFHGSTKSQNPKNLEKLRRWHAQHFGVGAAQAAEARPSVKFPLTLNSKRSKPRSWNENEEEEKGVEEVLVIDVEYDSTDGVRFDVFINNQGDNEIGPQDSEFAGSFVTLPHSPHVNHNNITKASFRLGSNKRR